MAKKRDVLKNKKKDLKNQDSRDNKILFAFLAAFLSIIGFFIALLVKKDDEYVMHYAKQSLVIFIIGVIAGIIDILIRWMPFVGWIIHTALGIIIFILWLLSWIYALSGKEKDIPIVSDWTEKINL